MGKEIEITPDALARAQRYLIKSGYLAESQREPHGGLELVVLGLLDVLGIHVASREKRRADYAA